jgi:riboflavin kinase/FMN adenylyltransferase
VKLLRGNKTLSALRGGAAVTLGNFDGVHSGHQALFTELKINAQRLKLPTLVVFFEPQPCEYFDSEAAPARLMTRREKLNRLSQSGIDFVYCLRFDHALASMLPINFAERFIFSLFKAKYLLVGEDFRFGCRRLGDLALLRELGPRWQCDVRTCPDFSTLDQRVSSTQIRQALRAGDLSKASTLLGQPYCITGRVIPGDGRGRQWGIPTANLSMTHRKLPMSGVFCVRVKRSNQSEHWGVANLGCRPTFGGMTQVLEVHLFDFDESLYHERIDVFFLHRLREEIKFSSMDALIAQIRSDLVAARNLRPHLTNG